MGKWDEVKTKDTVRIVGGQHQGKTGKVTSIAGSKCSVKVDSSSEDISVAVNDCEVIDDS